MNDKWRMCLILCCVLGLLFQIGCSTAEDTTYTLSVTVGEGITGTPATGSNSYTEGETVSYSYALQTGYENLEVRLDGVVVGNTGVITMNMAHTLTVTADELFNPVGDWEGTLVYSVYDYVLTATFSGGYYSGTVNGTFDTADDGSGTYSISGNSINFNMVFSWGELRFFGSIDDNNNISGTWEEVGSSYTGNWSLTRQ